MPPIAKVGKYELALEQRGLRLSRVGTPTPVGVRPFLAFYVTESGKARVPFSFDRIVADEATGRCEVVGYYTQTVMISAMISPMPETEGLKVVLRVENSSHAMQARVTAELILSGEAEPRWLVPGFLYGDNRIAECQQYYPSFSEVSRDYRRFISNQWSFRSDRTALPIVCAWTYGCFSWIATEGTFGRTAEQPDGVGMTGLRLSCDEGQPVMGVDMPYQETPVKYSYCHEDKTDPEDIFIYLPEKTPLTGTFMVGLGEPHMQAYSAVVRGWYEHYKDTHGHSTMVPSEYAEQMAHMGLLRWHYEGQHGAIYEATSFDYQHGRRRGEREPAIMHTGWASGAFCAWTLLRAGRESSHAESITAANAVLNKITSQLSPAGTLFPAWTEEAGWACSFGPEEGCAHSRTVAEGVLYILRSLMVELQYNSNHPQWIDAAIQSLNYAIGAQREDGALPSYFDLSTGRPVSYEGCSGLAWTAALALGSQMLHRPHYRDVALRAGDYYASFIETHFLCGSVEDQPFVPTSDDAHWAVIAYVALYEMDRDLKWLDLARKSADLAMTWRMAYNVTFSPHSILNRYGFQTKGGDINSTAVPQLGISGVLAYLELRKLAAYLGDFYFEARAEDARRYASQLVVLEDGHWNGRSGMVLGQVCHTDFIQPKGTFVPLSQAIPAALIKHVEITRRVTDLTKARLAPISREELTKELGRVAPSYAEVAMEQEPPRASSGAISREAISRAPFGGMGSGDSIGLQTPARASGDRPPTASQRQSRSEPPQASPGIAFPMGSDNPIAAMLGLNDPSPRRTPVPTRTPAGGARQPGAPEPERHSGIVPAPQPFSGNPMPSLPQVEEGGEDIEIKYKIF